MTFTVQEVPDWDMCEINDEEFKLYEINLPDILDDNDRCQSTVVPAAIKSEDPYQPSTSVISSASNNKIDFRNPGNPYFPQEKVAGNLASSSCSHDYSPADNSMYCVPTHSVKQEILPQNMMDYSNKPQFLLQQLEQQQQQQQQKQQQQQQQLLLHRQQRQLEQSTGRLTQSYPPSYNAGHVVPQPNECGRYFNYYMGKMRLTDDELSPAEYEKRRLRRERNKEAALRCRNKRRERIEALEEETSAIEAQNEKVEKDISKLRNQIDGLQSILKSHACKSTDNPENS